MVCVGNLDKTDKKLEPWVYLFFAQWAFIVQKSDLYKKYFDGYEKSSVDLFNGKCVYFRGASDNWFCCVYYEVTLMIYLESKLEQSRTSDFSKENKHVKLIHYWSS